MQAYAVIKVTQQWSEGVYAPLLISYTLIYNERYECQSTIY